MPEVRHEDLGETLFTKMFSYSPKLRILDISLGNPYLDFKSEVIRELGMSKQTFYKNFKDLEELGILKHSTNIGKATMYRINMEHPIAKSLDDVITDISTNSESESREVS